MVLSFALLLAVQFTGWNAAIFAAYRTLGAQPLAGLIYLAALLIQEATWRQTLIHSARGERLKVSIRWRRKANSRRSLPRPATWFIPGHSDHHWTRWIGIVTNLPDITCDRATSTWSETFSDTDEFRGHLAFRLAPRWREPLVCPSGPGPGVTCSLGKLGEQVLG